METVYRDYAPQGVKFFYIYKALAHPEHNGYVAPFTLKERLMHIAEFQRTVGSQVPWICDTMENDLKHALGDAPNSEFIIDPDGNVARKRMWSNPQEVRKDLEELVGLVANPTKISNLDLKTAAPPRVAARGVVPRIERPRSMKALRIEPQVKEDDQPFYAKLRAEADEQVLRGGQGRLYLGFHLDPLYHVHWNNLTKPIRVELTAPEGVELSATTLDGPKIEEAADVDPREFLIDVKGVGPQTPLEISVYYFACNDEAGWCKAVKQQYTVNFEVDPDGGWPRPGGRGRPEGRRPDGERPVGERPARARPGGERPGRFAGADRASGRVAAVAAGKRTLTIRMPGGKEQEFAIAADAQMMRARQRATLADCKAGDEVRFQFERPEKGPPTITRLMVLARGER